MKMGKDSTCGVGNSFISEYEVLLILCSFLSVSLNVLVSFSIKLNFGIPDSGI
jgi:hypothetical protein